MLGETVCQLRAFHSSLESTQKPRLWFRPSQLTGPHEPQLTSLAVFSAVCSPSKHPDALQPPVLKKLSKIFSDFEVRKHGWNSTFHSGRRCGSVASFSSCRDSGEQQHIQQLTQLQLELPTLHAARP
jgi:hypothetical protein